MRFEKVITNHMVGVGACDKANKRHDRIKNSNCWMCGKKPESTHDVIKGRAFCYDCRSIFYEQERERKERARMVRIDAMLEGTYDIYDLQLLDLYEYRDAIEVVYNAAVDDMRFDSAPEMAFAAMMISQGIKVSTQYSIGNYRVDFYLKHLDIGIEIDGGRHVANRDIERDDTLRSYMSPDYETLHIPEHYVKSNLVNIPQAIIYAAKFQRKTRREHGGKLPYDVKRQFTGLRDIWNRKDFKLSDLL